MTTLPRQVEKHLSEVLELRTKLRRAKAGIFTWSIDVDWLGWLGLNSAFYPGQPKQCVVNPVVGIRHQPTERLIAELQGARFHRYLPPTVARNLGYVTSAATYRSWSFVEGRSWNEQSEQLAMCFAEAGERFQLELANLPRLESHLREHPQVFQSEFRHIAVLHLLGRDAEASAYAEARLREISSAGDRASSEFRAFGQRYLAFAAAREQRGYQA